MIQLKHIEELDAKVQSALLLITRLRGEKNELVAKLDGYQKRIAELEALVSDFKADQGEIEAGILRALKQLDSLEDSVSDEEVSDADPDTKKDSKSPLVKESREAPKSSASQTQSNEDTQKAEPDISLEDAPEEADPANKTKDSSGSAGEVQVEPDVENDDEESDKPDIGESELDIF